MLFLLGYKNCYLVEGIKIWWGGGGIFVGGENPVLGGGDPIINLNGIK